MSKTVVKKIMYRLKLVLIVALVGAGILMILLIFGEKYLPLSVFEAHVCPNGFSLKLNPSTNIDSRMHPGRSVTTISPTCESENQTSVPVPDIVVIIWIYAIFFCAILMAGIVGALTIPRLWSRYVGTGNTRISKRRRTVVSVFLQIAGIELMLSALTIGIILYLIESLDVSPTSLLARNLMDNPLLWIVIFFIALSVPSFFIIKKVTR